VHWLSDVIGGLVGGVTYLLVVLLLIDRRLRAATPWGGPFGISRGRRPSAACRSSTLRV